MSRNTKQEKIEIIRYETEEFANTNERIADILTDFNNEKAENSEVNNPNGFVIGQPIETTSTTVSLPLDAIGKNSATFSGVTRTKTTGDLFNFTAVSAGKLKSLIVYAKPDAQIFYLAEGAEGTEAITPIYNGLFVAGITVSDSGEIIDSGTAKEFKQKADDGWKSTLLNSNSGVWLTLETPQSSFEVLATGLVTTPKIKGILTNADKNIWNGKRILIRNNTGLDIITEVVDPLPIVTGSTYMSFAIVNTLKKDIDHWFTMKDGKLEILKSGGGGSSFPQIGNDGDVLTKDSTLPEGAKWDGSLKASLNAEIVERAAQDAILNTKINTEVTNRTSADDYLLSQIVADAVRILALENKGYELTDQIVVNSNSIAQESWKGKVVFITTSCTITIPATLSTNYSFNGITIAGVSLTWAITSPKNWAYGTPTVTLEKQIFTLMQRQATNDIYLLGL